MRLITLMENDLGARQDLFAEHGLSIYLEADGQKILFDTGQSGKFMDNAKKLQIDLTALDAIIISHGHYDHSGGLKRLIEEINPSVTVYLGAGFFNPKYSLRETGDYQYTGNPFDQDFLKKNKIAPIFIKDKINYISKNLFIIGDFIRDPVFENTNQTMFLKENKYQKDQFKDEIALGIKTAKGLVLIVGCSHPGIVNMLETVIKETALPIYGLIGGLHLVKEDDQKINKIIDYLKEKEINIIKACHCTGKQGETMLSQQLADQFRTNNTGDSLEI